MRYHERLNIVLMRDKGPRRSFQIRRSSFILLLFIFACLPFLCIALASHCWILWQENTRLKDGMDRFEIDYQNAEMRAERLENLEELLKEENVQGRELALRSLAGEKPAEKTADNREETDHPELAEGPGHEEFPVLDTGRVLVSNVQARARRGNSLRIALDLRNPENEPLLSGEVEATLVTAQGERQALQLSPREMGNFSIRHFKRAVLTASVPRRITLDNAQVILEVRDQASQPIYRNIFAVQR